MPICADEISFVTFGMFIIDEIEYTANQKPQQNLIGGAGTYAALGARLVALSAAARKVSWIVDKGHDFPVSFTQLIESWGTTCRFRVDDSRLTTRAWNGYGPNEHREFKYLTPKIRLEVDSLTDEQTMSRSFHMVCSPARCKELSMSLRKRRADMERTSPKPIIIWEPIPDLCTPAELKNLQAAAKMVTVVSPNADELAQFFGSDNQIPQLEMVKRLIGWDVEDGAGSTHVVIREGAQGSTVYFAPSIYQNIKHGIQSISISAYHDLSMADKVIDPTGGGNTYLGALAMAMAGVGKASDMVLTMLDVNPAMSVLPKQCRVLLCAAINATIAAGYAIEQCGTPSITPAEKDVGLSSNEELWNGESFLTRLNIYVHREEERLLAGIEHMTQEHTRS